jgi:hypothetical protein
MTAGTASAGWYPDNQDPAFQRWWDGTQWTLHTQPRPGPLPPPATVASLNIRGVPLTGSRLAARCHAIGTFFEASDVDVVCFNIDRDCTLFSDFISGTRLEDAFEGRCPPTFRAEYLPAGAKACCTAGRQRRNSGKPEDSKSAGPEPSRNVRRRGPLL